MVADNTTSAAGPNVASRKVTYSGDAGVDLQTVNLALVAGSDDAKTVADVDGNSGNKSAGTIRVVIATDQPSLTNAQPVSDGAGSLTVDNAGTFVVQDNQVVADNAAFTDGTTKVQPVGYIFDEVAGTALTENDTAAARINANRAQVSVIEDDTTRGRRATVTAGNALKVDASSVAIPITDNAGSLTVDGTVAVTNADLTTLAGAVRAEDVASADAHTGIPAMAVRKATPANTSGTDGDYEMLQLSAGRLWASATIDAALPAGTNAIGKLAANSGVIIGDVNIVGNPAGTGVEDAAETAGGVLHMMGAVRRDTAASSSGTTGDNSTINTDAVGKLWTTGSFAEDVAHTDGDVGQFILARRIDTLASSAGSSGDYAAVNVDSLGAVYVVSEERLVVITATPTTTNGAYSAGDVVGGLLTFANAARFSGGPIVVESLTIMSKTPALNNSLELWLFDQTFTNVADNGAVSYSDADAANCIGVITCGPWVDNALNSISTRAGIGLSAVLAGTSLFGQLVTRNGPTLTSTSDIVIKLVLRQG